MAVKVLFELVGKDLATAEFRKVGESAKKAGDDVEKSAKKGKNEVLSFAKSIKSAAIAIGLWEIGKSIVRDFIGELIEARNRAEAARIELSHYAALSQPFTDLNKRLSDIAKNVQKSTRMAFDAAAQMAIMGDRLGQSSEDIEKNARVVERFAEIHKVDIPTAMLALAEAQGGAYERVRGITTLNIKDAESLQTLLENIRRTLISDDIKALEAQLREAVPQGEMPAIFTSAAQIEKIRQAIAKLREEYESIGGTLERTNPAREAIEKHWEAQIEAAKRLEKQLDGLAGGYDKVADSIEPLYDMTVELKGAVESLGSALGTALGTMIVDSKNAAEAWKRFAEAVIKEIAALIVKYIALYIWKSLATNPSVGAGNIDMPAIPASLLATGGVMRGEMGEPTPVRSYAQGGIAHSPQLALFGEGGGAEAFVPLPDGRSIPVTMNNGGGGNTYNVNIQATDAESVQRLLARNKALVVSFVAEATRRSPNFRRVIQNT